MKYLGKVGIIIPSGIVLCLVGTVFGLLYKGGNIIILILFAVNGLFLIIWHFPTYLLLEKDYIEVRIGFQKKKIFCRDIISFQKTHDSIQSYALSLDRIKIVCSNNDNIMVSLRKNDEFIEQMINNYPNIKYIKA